MQEPTTSEMLATDPTTEAGRQYWEQQRESEQQRQITDEQLPDRPTVDEVALWLRKSRNTIYLWCAKGEIPHTTAGRSKIFSKSALIEWANGQREEAA